MLRQVARARLSRQSLAMALTETLQPVREWHDVDRARFEQEIVPAYQPAVLRGLVKDWPVVRSGGSAQDLANHLAQYLTAAPVDTFVGRTEIRGRFFYLDDLRGVNFEKRQIPLGATLARLIGQQDDPEALCIYAGSVPAGGAAPGFAEANPNPLLDPEVEPRIWIGSAANVAPHYDQSAGMACVVRGRRRFTLFPPDQVGNLYVGPLEYTVAGQPASMVSLDEPDFERYPRFAEALKAAQVAELEPGDAIYIPALWWHGVRSFDPVSMLVNYWWGHSLEGSPFECLVHGLLAIRDLPEPEREAWRAIFDHYLFGRNGDPAAHLPEYARGVLGPASPQRAEMIRSFLIKSLAMRQG